MIIDTFDPKTEDILTTDKYIVFGGSGCLNKEIARGRVMVPTEAYRDQRELREEKS